MVTDIGTGSYNGANDILYPFKDGLACGTTGGEDLDHFPTLLLMIQYASAIGKVHQ